MEKTGAASGINIKVFQTHTLKMFSTAKIVYVLARKKGKFNINQRSPPSPLAVFKATGYGGWILVGG